LVSNSFFFRLSLRAELVVRRGNLFLPKFIHSGKIKFVMRKFYYLIILFIFSGCSATSTNVGQNYCFDKNGKRSLVIGRIDCSKFDKFSGLQDSLWVRFKNKSNHKAYSVSVYHSSASDLFFGGHRQGIALDFYLLMEPGKYHIERISLGKQWNLDWPGIYITVPQQASVLYVGTLCIEKDGDASSWGRAPVCYQVVDEKEKTLQEVAKALPAVRLDAETRLMEQGNCK